MKVELRSVEINRKLSEETVCFSASLWVDGFRVAEVSNRGHGGCNDVRIVGKTKYAELEAYVATLPPLAPGPTDWEQKLGPLPMCMEIFIGELLADWEERQQLKRHCRTKIMFRLKSQTYKPNEWLIIKAAYNDRTKQRLTAQYGSDLGEILNETIGAAR